MPRYNTELETLAGEVEIHPFRGSGPGGQHRNKVESAIRLLHKPSGITVVASDHKLQGKNRELAFERLQRKLVDLNKPRKRRVATKPSRAARARRLEQKRLKSRKKALRRMIGTASD
jgi:ribosome-associated protein